MRLSIGLILYACLSLVRAADLEFFPKTATSPSFIRVTHLTVESAGLVLCSKSNDDELSCAFAVFPSKNNGFSTLTDAPVNGAYSNVDPLGLFWSKEKVSYAQFQNEKKDFLDQIKQLELGKNLLLLKEVSSDGGRVISSVQIRNEDMPITVEKIKSGEVSGLLYQLPNLPPKALVFVLGGCPEPNNLSPLDAYIAAHQLWVFNFYYTKKNNPDALTTCAGSIDFIVKGVTWFKKHFPDRKLYIIGQSKGAEAARWIAHLYPDLVDGIVAMNGTTIQLPSTLDGSWTHRGSPLNTIEKKLSNLADKGSYNLSGLFSSIAGTKKMSQRTYIENVISKYDEAQIFQDSIPINCKIPTLSIHAMQDELLPVSASIAIEKKFCANAARMIENINASHDSFEIGWDNHRCHGRVAEHPEFGKLDLCKANVAAGKNNAKEILRFLHEEIAGR